MSKASVPVMLPRLAKADEVLPYLREIDQAQVYSNGGALLRKFEARIGNLLGVDPETVVACSSATLGIQGAVSVLGKSKWTIPSFTFSATALAVRNAGREILWADVDLETFQLNTIPVSDTDARSIDRNDAGVLTVCPFGSPLPFSIYDNAKVGVIDAAASLGQALNSPFHVASGWAVVFSLHATKVLGIGEGGLAVFGNIDAANAFREWANFGFSGKRESTALATNAKLSEIAAAYGHAALDGMVSEAEDWRIAQDSARVTLSDLGLENITLGYPSFNPYCIARFSDAYALLRAEQLLEEHGIGTRRWWPIPVHRMQAFSEGRTKLPNSETLASTLLGLPMYRGLESPVYDRIHEILGEINS